MAVNIGKIYKPISDHFRRERMRAFCEQLNIGRETRVLDVGGSRTIWQQAPVKPHLTILNLYPRSVADSGENYVRASGCRMPFADNAFDVVFSNSVIEHLGAWPTIQTFADEVRRVGRRYWVQTPNRRFPIEPHYLAPFLHYAPKSAQKRLLRYGSGWGLLTKPSTKQVSDLVDELYLLDRRELASLFPDADVRGERFMGIDKSLVAWK